MRAPEPVEPVAVTTPGRGGVVAARGARARLRTHLGLCLCLTLAAPPFLAAARAEDLHRHRAAITVLTPAALVRLPLTPEVYARSRQPGLADLRIVDARGDRVPFAWLAPRGTTTQTTETLHEATLYPLPPRPAQGEWTAPVEVSVDGGRVVVRQRGTPPRAAAHATHAAQSTRAATGDTAAPGYLVDLGEPGSATGDARPATGDVLRLQWEARSAFSAGYTLAHSADLKTWREAPGGQLGEFAAASGAALVQRDVALPVDCGRFVRLVWSGDGTPPLLRAVQRVARRTTASDEDPPQPLRLAPASPPGTPDAATPRALHFDLGASMPVVRVDLELPAGTRVLPVQVQVRERADAPWRSAAGTVFYRLDRSDGVARPPALALGVPARWVRLVVDERAALPPTEGVHLRAEVQLASLVFSRQGTEPFVLQVGSADAAPGALPLATVVPDLAAERPRLGQASLGAWTEVGEAAAQASRREQLAAARPWLLWTLLAGGVAALALMVWRLTRPGVRGGA